MLHRLIVFIFLVSFTNLFSQNKIQGTSYSHFQIKLKNDTIDFVIADTSLNVKKPLLLFCQGSQPVPLFIKLDSDLVFPVTLSNFNVNELNENYHVCVISMPKTPVLVEERNLDDQYCYITDTTRRYSYSREYINANYQENYVKRANLVLKFLRKQSWINNNKLIVSGHSQGARVAVGIAHSNRHVTHLGLFGYNPSGRIEQILRRIRRDAETGHISWEKADSLQRKQYEFYQLLQYKDSIHPFSSRVSWSSFSKPTVNELVELKIPVYIAYGSEDIIAVQCDLLPLLFIDNSKENYLIKRYPNLNHNFFPLSENHKPKYREGKWKVVFNEFIDWCN